MPITTRFAPSPTGFLHLGHAFSALTAWRRARAAGGRFLLRLEDIDSGRCRAEFSEAILFDLAWLGLDWDGEVRAQSAHFPDYRATLDALDARGLLYPCFCTRADILREIGDSAVAPHTPDGAPLYPGTCRALPADIRAARIANGMPHALRLDMTRAMALIGTDHLTFEEEGTEIVACAPEKFGDLVLARKDAPASYHLCVTHDDALQGVTLVTRGQDLMAATDVQRLLQALMGWPAPVYAHHRLLTDASGRRLAKRDHAATLRDLRARGVSPAAARAMAGAPD
jgi:glutamyl-Q tRNA(Asp) synthetase